MKERLQKIIARSTKLSRRDAEEVISSGRVKLNGKVVKELGTKADAERDKILLDNHPVRTSQKKIYLKYNKPKDRLVTKKDKLGRATIWKDLYKFKDKLNSAGRLDYSSEGLLILTNDGELINHLTHPRYHLQKIYRVKVKGVPDRDKLDKIRSGIEYDGVRYQPAEIEIINFTKNNCWLEVRIREGKYRQIRKMFEAISHPVLKLKRLAIGPVKLRNLKTGDWSYLTVKERKALLKSVR